MRLNHTLIFAALSSSLLLMQSGGAMAKSFASLNVGTNITINDSIWNSYWSGGSPALNVGNEDNETERTEGGAPTYTGQRWDFEGMFWNGSQLTLISGWNFQTGVPHNGTAYHVGDLFIGSLGPHSPQYVNGQPFTATEAIDFSRNGVGGLDASGTFTKFLAGNFTTDKTWDVAPLSDPYQVKTTIGQGITSTSFTYETGFLDDVGSTGFLGWKDSDLNDTPNNSHYYLQISGLNGAELYEKILHITVLCGNDVGRGEVPVPEPATMLLLGTGLVGLAGLRRRKK